jgi:hypothetical protein
VEEIHGVRAPAGSKHQSRMKVATLRLETSSVTVRDARAPAAAGSGHVEPDAARALLDRIGARPAADGARAGEPSLRLKRPLCFGHSMMPPTTRPVGEVGVAVGADAVGGEEVAAASRIARRFCGRGRSGSRPRRQIGGGADSSQPSASGSGVRDAASFLHARLRRREPALHVVGRGPSPAAGGRAGFRARRTGSTGRVRAVVLHDLVQPRQGVVGHQREHVVLHVVVHVPVEEAVQTGSCRRCGS